MGIQTIFAITLMVVTFLLHIGSYLFDSEFMEMVSYMKVAVPIIHWAAILSLVLDILLAKADRFQKWVFSGLSRTLLVVISSIVGHATIYRFGALMSSGEPVGNTDWITSIYFSIVTWTTLGYGDFSPTKGFYLVAASQAFMGYVTIGIFIGLIFYRNRN